MPTLRNKYHDLGNNAHTVCMLAGDLEATSLKLKEIIDDKASAGDVSKHADKMRSLAEDIAKQAGIIQAKVIDTDNEISNLRNILYRCIDPDVDLQVYIDKIKEENSKIRIFVADDEKIIVESLVKKYRDEGYLVDFALSTADAMEKMDQFIPNILITDIYFSGRASGLELIKHVKSNMQWVQILVVSSVHDKSIINEIKDLGVEEILEKPASYVRISAKLSGMVQAFKR